MKLAWLGCFLAFSSLANAAPISPQSKVDPVARRVARTGLTSTTTKQRVVDHAPIVIELRRAADDDALLALTTTGVSLDRFEGRPLRHGRFVAAHASEAALDKLGKLDLVARVHSAPTFHAHPLNHAAELIRLADGRGARPALDLLTGAGITIGDSDSLVDVFAPAFFRGDAGYFDWIDVNHDGVFSPDADAIDLDRDGLVGTTETAYQLRAATYDGFYYTPIPARPNTFDPGLDWVYLDLDGNQKRDYGPPMFEEATPAFGEPLFTPDDVNRNGKIDPGERFVRLGTSKFKKVQVQIAYGAQLDRIFVRGEDLSETPADLTGGQLYGFADALHATGVSTILAGDLPLAGRKWVGIAPDADLITSFDVDNGGDQLPVDSTMWMLEEGANVMLYEMAPWTGLALDGTDALSMIIDSSTASSNVTHTCPTGDQGSARKHGTAEVAANTTVDLPWDLPEKIKAGYGPLSLVQVSLHLRGADATSVKLIAPDGSELPITDLSQGENGPGNIAYYMVVQTTPRNTYWYDVFLYTTNKSSSVFPVGQWKVRVAAGASPVTVHGYLSDDLSSWAAGAAWDVSVASEDRVIGVPSTADHCIAVGAIADHTASEGAWFESYYEPYFVAPGFEETQYQVRAYSPVGPRLDGVIKPDVVAPDNPWVANAHIVGASKTETAPFGSYSIFGGTSGASPHVTGVAALLAQAGIYGDAARDAMRTGAITKPEMGTLPNGEYGFGLLDAAGALGATAIGSDPTVTATFSPAAPRANQEVTITLAASGGDNLEMKWDDEYDGTWDTAYAPVGARSVRLVDPKQTSRVFKVRVRNASGHFAEAVVQIPFLPAAKGCSCDTTALPIGEQLAALFVAALMLLGLRARRVYS